MPFLKHGSCDPDGSEDIEHEFRGHGVSSSWIRSKIEKANVSPERLHDALQKAGKGRYRADKKSDTDDSDEAMRRLGHRTVQVASLVGRRGFPR